MKMILLAAASLVFGLALNAQTPTADDVIKVNTDKFDFGKIKQGVPVETYFEITNKTDKPVVVENTWGSCGCTVPEKPKDPIAPGQTIKLKVNYNAAAPGHFDKTVSIKLAGVDQPKVVSITGETVSEAPNATPVVTTPTPQTNTQTPAPQSTKVKAKAGKLKVKTGS
jgi:hypothetical protein